MKYFQNSYDLDDEVDPVGNLSAALGATVACVAAFVLAWGLRTDGRPAPEIANGFFAVSLLLGLVSAFLGLRWWSARKAFAAQETKAQRGPQGVSVARKPKRPPLG